MSETTLKNPKCPLIETLFELRFDNNNTSIDPIMYAFINDSKKYKDIKRLPAHFIPTKEILGDPQLKYAPQLKYLFNQGNDYYFSISMSLNAITISHICTTPNKYYGGWNLFKKILIENLNKLKTIFPNLKIRNIILQYINLFQNEDIFHDLNVNYSFKNEYFTNLIHKEYKFRKDHQNDIISYTNIIPNQEVVVPSPSSKNHRFLGTIMDIRVHNKNQKSLNLFFENINDELNNLHSIEKEIFLNLLPKDVISDLNLN